MGASCWKPLGFDWMKFSSVLTVQPPFSESMSQYTYTHTQSVISEVTAVWTVYRRLCATTGWCLMITDWKDEIRMKHYRKYQVIHLMILWSDSASISKGKHLLLYINVNLRPREEDVYLDSRPGSIRIDGEHPTALSLVMMDDTAVLRMLFNAAGERWSQEEDDDWEQLNTGQVVICLFSSFMVVWSKSDITSLFTETELWHLSDISSQTHLHRQFLLEVIPADVDLSEALRTQEGLNQRTDARLQRSFVPVTPHEDTPRSAQQGVTVRASPQNCIQSGSSWSNVHHHQIKRGVSRHSHSLCSKYYCTVTKLLQPSAQLFANSVILGRRKNPKKTKVNLSPGQMLTCLNSPAGWTEEASPSEETETNCCFSFSLSQSHNFTSYICRRHHDVTTGVSLKIYIQ